MGIGTCLVTRCKPEMFLGKSLGDGESSLGGERDAIGGEKDAIGTSESRSRLFASRLGCGRGRSPRCVNSYRISLNQNIYMKAQRGVGDKHTSNDLLDATGPRTSLVSACICKHLTFLYSDLLTDPSASLP